MLRSKISFFALVGLILLLSGCLGGGRPASTDLRTERNVFTPKMKYARYLHLIDHEGGWTEAEIIDPWDTTRLLQRLILVPENVEVSKDSIPMGSEILKIPLTHSLVQPTVHIGLLEEMGASEAIAGVSDASFVKSPATRKGLEKGTIVDCGSWLSPNLERIIRLAPDAILSSPYPNSSSADFANKVGIPIIYLADYMEPSPLGRAEWMKFYGILYGKEEVADSIFSQVESKYVSLSKSGKKASTGKKIIFDVPQSGIWYMPVGGSANDFLIKDAGGINPFSEMDGNQFVALSTEEVLHTAHDADIWLLRLNSNVPITLEQLKKDYPFAKGFKAFKEGNVWAVNTNEVSFYEETPFHPEYQLEDIVKIIKGEESTDSLRYFKKVR